MKNKPTINQLLHAEKKGVDAFITPDMSAEDVNRLIGSQDRSEYKRKQKEILRTLISQGLHEGCEVFQKFSENSSRWVVIHKIDQKILRITFRIHDKTYGYTDNFESFTIEEPIVRNETIMYIPEGVAKRLLNGKSRTAAKNALITTVLPNTGFTVYFLPIIFYKSIKSIL